MKNIWKSEFEFKSTNTGATQYYLDDRYKINDIGLLKTHDLHFKNQKCLDGVSYQYIKDLDDIYDKTLLCGDGNSINSMYNEFNIIEKYLENLHRIDIAMGGEENSDFNINITYHEIDGIKLIVGHTILIFGQEDKIKNNIYVVNHDYTLRLSNLLDTREKSDKAKFYIKLGTYTESQFFLLNESIIFPTTHEIKSFIPYHSYIIKNKINYDLNNSADTAGILFSNYDVARHQQDNNNNIRNMVIDYTSSKISANFSHTIICSGITVDFQVDNNENIDIYEWDFGGGVTSSESAVTHTYMDNLTHTISLSVHNTLFNLTDTVIKVVEPYTPINIGFEIPNTTTCTNHGVLIVNNTIAEPPITEYLWDFGDGTTQIVEDNDPIIHVYDTIGNYSISLSATNNICVATSSATDCIHIVENSDIDFVSTTTNINIGCSVSFTAITSATIINYYWDFGDGNISTEEYPTHNYETIGYSDVKLIVESDNCSNDIIKYDYVNVFNDLSCSISSCVDLLTASQGYYYTNLRINFNSTVISQCATVTYLWDFGDGTYSTLENPEHIYTASGTYNVLLTVTNQYNISATQTNPMTIVDTYDDAISLDVKTSSVDQVIKITLSGTCGIILWGDGTSKEIYYDSEVEITHDYGEVDINKYTILIVGTVSSIKIINQPILIEILSWGDWKYNKLSHIDFSDNINLIKLSSFSFNYLLSMKISNCGITSLPTDTKPFLSNAFPLTLEFSENQALAIIPPTFFIDCQLYNADNLFKNCTSLSGPTPQLWDDTIWTEVISFDDAFTNTGALGNYGANIPIDWGGTCDCAGNCTANCSGGAL